jgi:bacterioferritin
MKGHDEIIALLNKGLGLELTAVNQYLAQSKMSKRWGYHKLAAHLYADYQDERTHAEKLIERILFLEGSPDIKVGEPIKFGKDVKEMIENDLALETKVVNFYNDVAARCLELKDSGSRELADFLLQSSEKDVQELESHLHLIGKIGLENYLIEMIGEEDDGEGKGHHHH